MKTEIAGQIVGSGKLNKESGMIDTIFVEPAFMGKGSAKAMIVYLENMALECGLKLLKLESTLNAVPFYRSCGFVGKNISVYHSPRGISMDCVPTQKALKFK